jgi:catechol 2,3-dioxygenase-like lactoylglutathione lyase family enzyme
MLLSIHPIGQVLPSAVPVRDLTRATRFYVDTLGFSRTTGDDESVSLRRDDVEIRLVADRHHDAATADSFYIEVTDLDALRVELQNKSAKPGPIGLQSHGGHNYRVFFLRECDMLEVHEGYCFCFGTRV